MSTFLQLCRAVARDSGTVSNLPAPATTASQTGRPYRITEWVKDAYRMIQLRRDDWRWLTVEFSGQTIASTRSYDSAAMSISERFGHWVFHNYFDNERTFSAYLTSAGQDDEWFLSVVPWDRFRARYMVGTAATDSDKPRYVSVDPQGNLVFYPTPDAAYTIKGQYYKAPQELSEDVDVPEMPARFHEMIKWGAILELERYDEAPITGAYPYRKLLSEMEFQQTPRIEKAGPLA